MTSFYEKHTASAAGTSSPEEELRQVAVLVCDTLRFARLDVMTKRMGGARIYDIDGYSLLGDAEIDDGLRGNTLHEDTIILHGRQVLERQPQKIIWAPGLYGPHVEHKAAGFGLRPLRADELFGASPTIIRLATASRVHTTETPTGLYCLNEWWLKDIATRHVARFEGRVERRVGDGVLAIFGYPIAQEDAAERAVRAGRAIIEALGAIQIAGSGLPGARAAVTSGGAHIGQNVRSDGSRENELTGAVINLACRMHAFAPENRVVVSDSVRKKLRGLFDLEEHGVHVFKGIEQPVDLWVVGRELLGGARFQTIEDVDQAPMPRREAEIAPHGELLFAPHGELWFLGSTGGPVAVPADEWDRNRFDACRTLAQDLLAALKAGEYQVRREYERALEKYIGRLPDAPGHGNILLADAAARILRSLFAAEADFLSPGFAASLETFLGHHIGLRAYYPELEKFYRDVPSRHIEAQLLQAAVKIVEGPVSEALADSAEPAIAVAPPPAENRPPTDPLKELDPKKARAFTVAGTVNALWKTFLEGEKIAIWADYVRGIAATFNPLPPGTSSMSSPISDRIALSSDWESVHSDLDKVLTAIRQAQNDIGKAQDERLRKEVRAGGEKVSI